MDDKCRVPDKLNVSNIALEVTEACNYKCTMCDYWRLSSPRYMLVEDAKAFLDLFSPGTLKSVLITGGEPLLHPHWREIAGLLPRGVRKSICTNGSPILVKNHDVGDYFDRLTVSIDGARRETFLEIRGFDHLPRILEALKKLKATHSHLVIYVKMTLQRRNFREIVELMELALSNPFIDGVGFGAPDFSGAAFAFDRENFQRDPYLRTMLLTVEEIDDFERYIDIFEYRFADEIARGYVYEGDLRRYLQRFRSLRGLDSAPPTRRCIIPNVSAVLRADGNVLGCYFLKPVTTLQQLRASGVEFLNVTAQCHKSSTNATCARCDQLLFRNSPFELPLP